MPRESSRQTASLLAAAAIALAQLRSATAQSPPATPTTTCLTDAQVEDVLVHAGVQYLAGRFLHVRPPGTSPGDPTEVERRWFAACDAATGAVLAWDPLISCVSGAGPCTNARGQTLALAFGGSSIYLGGKFDTVGGVTHKHAAKVSLATAARDASFVPAPNDRVQRIVVAPGGSRLFVGGNFTAIGGCAPTPCHEYLAAVDPATGAIQGGFDPVIDTSDASFRSVYSMVLDSEGETIWFGGQFDLVNGETRTSIAAVDAATGVVNRVFAPRLEDANPDDPYVQVYDLRLDSRFLYVCGDWWSTETFGGQQDQRNVNRFHPVTGALDEDFWIATDGGVQACDLDPGLGLLFVGGHFDCVRAWYDRTTPVDPSPAQCGTDALFVGTQQRDLFALDLRTGDLVAWNPNTSGAAGTWAVSASPGRVDVGGELGWPIGGSPTQENLLVFELPLFIDGFESSGTDRWSLLGP